jgi:hypothetical protein
MREIVGADTTFGERAGLVALINLLRVASVGARGEIIMAAGLPYPASG